MDSSTRSQLELTTYPNRSMDCWTARMACQDCEHHKLLAAAEIDLNSSLNRWQLCSCQVDSCKDSSLDARLSSCSSSVNSCCQATWPWSCYCVCTRPLRPFVLASSLLANLSLLRRSPVGSCRLGSPTCTGPLPSLPVVLVYCNLRKKRNAINSFVFLSFKILFFFEEYSRAHWTPPTASFAVELQVRFEIEALYVLAIHASRW